jgi:hypothetical protein
MQKRYNVIRILENAGFTPCLWSEDALSYYNVPTVGFELYILLPDSDIERTSSLLAINLLPERVNGEIQSPPLLSPALDTSIHGS